MEDIKVVQQLTKCIEMVKLARTSIIRLKDEVAVLERRIEGKDAHINMLEAKLLSKLQTIDVEEDKSGEAVSSIMITPQGDAIKK